jgi:2-keto-4-pentenoate hydratase/2-oxohepta-3-ene-1,7-dioic acid hydratase in catechol pathway
MKLAAFAYERATSIGVVDGDRIINLAVAAPKAPSEMSQFLDLGDEALETAEMAKRGEKGSLALKDVRLLSPVERPGKILGIGLNYADHIAETGREPPEHQTWFNKQTTAINGPYGDVYLPSVSDQLDYEGELCFVIGKRCKHVPRDRAHEVIAGYFCGNDVSVRDWQFQTPTMQMGKSFDTHAPIGPWIVTPDEVGDPHNLEIKTTVNGETRQHSNTKHLIFDCYDQVAHLTKAFTLEPGDVIFTGTPSGVGRAMTPPNFLKVGDVVRVEIEKLGAIENKVIPEPAETLIG